MQGAVFLLFIIFGIGWLIYKAGKGIHGAIVESVCSECEKSKTLNQMTPYRCQSCDYNKHVCSECKNSFKYRSAPAILCKNDYLKASKIFDKMIVVKSRQIGNHRVVADQNGYITSNNFKDREQGVAEIKWILASKGFNGLVELAFSKVQTEDSVNGYIQNWTVVSGRGVKVEPFKLS